MIAWSCCFYLMGNHVSCVQLRQQEPPGGGGGGRSIKLIRWDGVVKMYERPIQVSELMLEFPKHRVCRSDSLYIGQKIPPLSQEDQLQPGHNYFLLPIHFFQSALSFLTITSFASSSTSISNNTSTSSRSNNQKKNAFLNKAKSSTTSNCQPFHMQKTPSGSVRIRVTEEFLWKLMMGQGKIKQQEEEDELDQDQDDGRVCCSRSSTSTSTSTSRVCTTAQLQKEYSQLVGYSRQSCWKPKLETITESTEKKKKKKKKKKLVAFFGVKRSIRKISHHSVL
ncbi:unnamed protein product [Camellia sinensis]